MITSNSPANNNLLNALQQISSINQTSNLQQNNTLSDPNTYSTLLNLLDNGFTENSSPMMLGSVFEPMENTRLNTQSGFDNNFIQQIIIGIIQNLLTTILSLPPETQTESKPSAQERSPEIFNMLSEGEDTIPQSDLIEKLKVAFMNNNEDLPKNPSIDEIVKTVGGMMNRPVSPNGAQLQSRISAPITLENFQDIVALLEVKTGIDMLQDVEAGDQSISGLDNIFAEGYGNIYKNIPFGVYPNTGYLYKNDLSNARTIKPTSENQIQEIFTYQEGGKFNAKPNIDKHFFLPHEYLGLETQDDLFTLLDTDNNRLDDDGKIAKPRLINFLKELEVLYDIKDDSFSKEIEEIYTRHSIISKDSFNRVVMPKVLEQIRP